MRRTIFAVLAVVFAVAALGSLALRLGADRDVEVGKNVLVNKAGVVEAHNSPSLARDPRRPDTIVATHRIDRPLFSAALNRSTDGGRSWRTTALPLPRGLDRPYAPDVAFAPDGTLYVTYVNLEGTGNVPANLWLSRSSDGGRTLSRPVRIAGRLTFQARVAVDPAANVHVTWLQGREVGVLQLAGGPSPIVASRSSDGGRTFSRPVRVSDPNRPRVGAASPVIDADGRLVVLYEDFKDDRRDFQNAGGPPWENPFALVVTRPTGGGAFSRGVQFESGVVPTRRFLVFVPEFPSLAAGPGDTLYAAWSDGRNGDEDVFLRRSDDDGRTWSPPKRVNDNPNGDDTSQYLPRVAVSPDGRVDVLFLDRRRDKKDVMTDATLASSEDEGGSFRNTRLSSRSFDSRVGASAARDLPVDFGSRLGLASADGRSLAAWTDTRVGSKETGRQDVFASSYEIPGPPGGLSRIPVTVGLALAGLVFAILAVASSSRRRGPQPGRL
ncbi:MAG: glycoside hydrolase [Chloroflexota bacterium]|nr:glycoside hydrolase [Chloroflexota bacterium]